MKRKIVVFCALFSLVCAALPPGLVDAQMISAMDGVEVGLSDSFDNARDADPHYGLNDNLGSRQAGSLRGATYTRVPGMWYDGDMTHNTLRPWHSQVDHGSHPGALSFHLRTSAVRLDTPLPTAHIKSSATLTPAVGANNRDEWASMSLANDAQSRGYVSDSQTMLGLLVSARGKVQIFQYGTLLGTGQMQTIPQNGTYAVEWTISNNNMQATINGKLFSFALRQNLPKTAWLFLGRYSDDAATVTKIDNFKVSSRTTGPTAPGQTSLRYFGYFASRIESIPANHVPDVRGFSNLNWVSISDLSGYRPQELAECKPAMCVLSTRWQFFQNCSPNTRSQCQIRPDAEAQWANLVQKIAPYQDRIAAFELMDEAYHNGATYEQVAKVASIIKSTFPTLPIMLNYAMPSLDAKVPVPPKVDWVAFDQYCVPVATLERSLTKLESLTANQPNIKLFMYVDSARNISCGSTKTDQQLADLQWQQYAMAQRHPRLLGILEFGLWTHEPSMSPLPKTIDIQQRIAAKILYGNRNF